MARPAHQRPARLLPGYDGAGRSPRARVPGCLWATLLGVLLALAAAGPLGAQTQADPEPERAAGAAGPAARARHAMVAAAHPLAVQAGLEMLRAGGNAVDAAVAAALALNVVEPQSSGIGGGAFLVLRVGGRVVTIDGREEAPAAATPEMFLEDGRPVPFYPERITGGRAVGVPGAVRAYEKALARFGRLGLARVVAPAVRLAEAGFPVTDRLAAALRRHRERLARFPATRALFFTAAGAPLPVGAPLRQPALARALRTIAAGGAAAFYTGEMARAMVAAVRDAPVAPGVLSLADLAGYDAPLRAPVRGTYRGLTLYGMGPPSSGGVAVLQMLGLLEPFDLSATPRHGPVMLHRFVQAVRLAYADRARYLADPDFALVPVAGLLDPGYLRRRHAALDWTAPLAPVEAGEPPGAGGAARGEGPAPESPSTTHLSVVDAERNLVALTATIEQAFGSGITVPGWGFLLNNEMTDFSARPRDRAGRPVANRVEGGRRPRRTALEHPATEGGKRMRSTMAPTLVLRGEEPLLVLGSPGGSRIAQYVAWVLIQVLDHGLDLQDAIAAPHVTFAGGRTRVEPGLLTAETRAALEALGHRLEVGPQVSGLHGIRIDPATGVLTGGADPRREGAAAGY